MEMRRLSLWVGLLFVLGHNNGAPHKLVCYFSKWALRRPHPAKVTPGDLNPTLCTHLILAFASMENNKITVKEASDMHVLYPQFNSVKERNSNLKTLLSVGGWDFGTTRFTLMLSSIANRKVFIESVVSFLRDQRFDGLDLFFLYPGHRGSPSRDRWTFLFLLEELRAAFQDEAQRTGSPRLLLSAAVSGDPHISQKAYSADLLSIHLDFINVLSYDFHGSWEKFTGHNSPLFSRLGDPKSLANSMHHWTKLGAPPQKLIMGLPAYGRSFRLFSASQNKLQSSAVGPGTPGQYTKQAGFLAYFEICSIMRRLKRHWIDDQYVPYAYKGRQWVGYDDPESFRYKALYIRAEHLGGAMVWTLDMDDVKGTFCGNGSFPLVSQLNKLLLEPAQSNLTPPPTHWSSPARNSSRTDSGRPTGAPNWTSLLLGKVATTSETRMESENVPTTPRDVSPTRDSAPPGNQATVLEGTRDCETTESMNPEEMTSSAP